jgi:hypothetical protein
MGGIDTPVQRALINKMSGGSSSAGGTTSLGMTLGVIGVVIIIVIGLIGLAVNGIKNAFSDTKIKVVSMTCDTEEKFVSIVEKALTGVTGTRIQGEEFTAYAQQARAAIKKRDNNSTTLKYKDHVYFVTLPDKVNVYMWFETETRTPSYIYKLE